MALPKTGSGSFKPARSYERPAGVQGGWADALRYRDSMMRHSPPPSPPGPAPLGMGDKQMLDRYIPQNPMPGAGDRQMLDSPSPFVGPRLPNRPSYPQGPPSQYDTAGRPIVDLSDLNTQGPATGSTFPGMFMQGAAGMAAGGMLTGSRMGSRFAEAESVRQDQLNPNFVGPRMQNPMQDGPWDQRASEETRRQGILSQYPMPGSSNQAGMLGAKLADQGLQNPMSAGAANGYNGNVAAINDPNRMTPEQKYAAAQQGARQMGQYDPTNMSGRFGSGSPLGQQAAAIEAGEAGVAAGTHIQTSGGYGEMPTYQERVPFSADQMVAERGRQHRQLGSTRTPGRLSEAESKAYAAGAPARKEASRVRKELEKTRKADVKFKHMVSKGMNPMSPQARAMFPNQVAQMNGDSVAGQNPMGSPFSPTAPDTVENRQARADVRKLNFEGSQTLQSFGATPDMSPDQFAKAVHTGVNTADLSPDGMQEIFNHVKTLRPDAGEDSPFNQAIMGHVGAADMWADLWNMPENTPPDKLADWFSRFKTETAKRLREMNTPTEGAVNFS